MQNKIVIAIVAILMAASFAGIMCAGEESDAAASYTIGVDGADKDWAEAEYSKFTTAGYSITKDTGVTNVLLGNDLRVVDGKVVGTVAKAKADIVKALWGADAEGDYIFVINFSGLTADSYINFIPSVMDKTTILEGAPVAGATSTVTSGAANEYKVAYQIKSIQADKDGNASLTFKSTNGTDALKGFSFVISANNLAGYDVEYTLGDEKKTTNAVSDKFNSYNKQTVEFDIEYIGSPVSIEYTVGDLIYTQKSNAGKTYQLVSLDALRAEAPEGKAFAGWYDATTKNTYPVGTVFVLNGNMEFSAIFEALPEAVITFVDGTSTLKSINVSDLSEKTVPSVEKTGYTFDGWFMGDVKVDPLTYTFEESVTLVAQWTPINCYVTFVAGDFVKTVPVLYGDRVQAPALPDGFEKWNFDFSVVITDDLTIAAIEKAPEKPTGLADPTVKMAMVIVGLFVCVLLAVIILKREDIRAGMVRKLSKAEDVKEDKKE